MKTIIFLLSCLSSMSYAFHIPINTSFVQACKEKYNLNLGSKTIQKPYTGKLNKLHGLCVGDLCILKTYDNFYTIVDLHDNEMGTISCISQAASIHQVRTMLLSLYSNCTQFGEAVIIEDQISPASWTAYFEFHVPKTKPGPSNAVSLTIHNLGLGITLTPQKELPLKNFARHLDNVIQGKRDDAVSFRPERFARFHKRLQEKKAKQELKEKQQEAEREQELIARQRKGFPDIGRIICSSVDAKNSWLARELQGLSIPKELKNSENIVNVFSLAELKSIWQGKLQDIDEKDQGISARLGGKGKCIFILIMRFQTKEEAKARLIQYRHTNPRRLIREVAFVSEEQVTAQTKIQPQLVGDFDLSLKHQFDESDCVIPKSNESAIYFQRGDTTVMLASQDPSISMLPLAKQIDKILIEKLQIADPK